MFVGLSLLLALTTSTVSASVLLVPENYPSIRSAVNAADHGDTVSVSAGEYSGPGNCDIVLGKRISLVAPAGSDSTVINCHGLSRCLHVIDTSASISGFRFIQGVAPQTVQVGIREAGQKRRQILPAKRSYVRRQRRMKVSVITVFLDSENGELTHQVRHFRKFGAPQSTLKPKMAKTRASDKIARSVGGCLLVSRSSMLTLTDLFFRDCNANEGGGIAAFHSRITLVNVSVSMSGVRATSGLEENVDLFGGDSDSTLSYLTILQAASY